MKLNHIHCVICATAVAAVLLSSCSDDTWDNDDVRTDTTHAISYSSSWVNSTPSSGLKIRKLSRQQQSVNKYCDFRADHLDEASEGYLLTAVEDHIDNSHIGKQIPTDEELIAQSRGTMLTKDNIADNHKTMSMYAYYHPSDATFEEAFASGDATPYITDAVLNITKSDDNLKLSSSTDYYWLIGDKKLTFFGILPTLKEFYGTTNVTITDESAYNIDLTTGRPRISVNVANSIGWQKDILCSTSTYDGDGKANGYTAEMPMKHIMAAVKVKLGTGFANRYITGITFTNVKLKGTYVVGSSGGWTIDNNTVGDRSATFVATKAVTELTDDNVFMMLPQEIGDNNQLNITVYDTTTSSEKTYTYSFSNSTAANWEMGKTYTYLLSTEDRLVEYVLEPEFDEINFSYNGTPAGDGDIVDNRDTGYTRIKSYKVVTAVGQDPVYTEVPWTATITSGSSVVASYPKSSADADVYTSTTDGDYNRQFRPMMTVQQGTAMPSNDAQQFAKRAATKTLGTKDEPLDLTYYKSDGTHWSTEEGNRFSSNCYMINYPGYYEIPIICGPAVNQDKDDESTFILGTSNQTGDYTNLGYLNNLVNFNEETLKSGWIQYWTGVSGQENYYPANNGDGESGARDTYIEWTDSPGSVELTYNYTRKVLVGSYWTGYRSSYYLLRFHVPENAKPGNTVISIRNPEDKVLWSYHIWVTSYTTDSTFVAQPNSQYVDPSTSVKFLKVPLGYVEDDYTVYQAREAKMLITQETSGKTREITLKQDYHECRPQSCCYYQWGRKDPFPGAKLYETGHLNHDDSYTIGYEEKTITSDVARYQNGIDYAAATEIVSSGILYPLTFFTGFQQPKAPNHYFDLWGCLLNYSKAENTLKDGTLVHYTNTPHGSSSHKTVYDPCPPGFKVPPIYAMPQFTIDGKNHTSTYHPLVKDISEEAELYNTIANTPYKSHDEFINNLGYEFYANRMAEDGTKSGPIYKLHAFGLRSCTDGSISGLGTHCYYWSCTRWVSGYEAVNTRIYYSHCGYSDGGSVFSPSECNTNTYGMPVLPMFSTTL
jgi:hypothetical protein